MSEMAETVNLIYILCAFEKESRIHRINVPFKGGSLNSLAVTEWIMK